jgi:quinol monooxygenase YgiN
MTEFSEDKQVYWIAHGTIKPGQESAFRTLCAKMVESTKAQAGALHYEWSISEDGTYFHIFERYAGSEAVKVHREQSAKLVKLLFTTIADLKTFTLYGNPTEEVKEWYASRHPIVMKPLNGFRRT